MSETKAAAVWTGVKFTCVRCTGEWQLEATDRCVLRLILNDHLQTYDAPSCPTLGCGHVNVIEIDRGGGSEVDQIGGS